LYDLIKADPKFHTSSQRPKRVNYIGWNRAKIVVAGNKVQPARSIVGTNMQSWVNQL
jgi:hypothetical protein